MKSFEFGILEFVKLEVDLSKTEDVWLSAFFDNQDKCYNFVKTSNALPRSKFSNDPLATKKLLSEKSLAAWHDPESRKRRLKVIQSKEYRKKQSDKQKLVAADPNNKNSTAAHKKDFQILSSKKDIRKIKRSLGQRQGRRRVEN